MTPRAVVIGCGSIGRRHLANLQSLGVRDLLASDPDPGADGWLREALLDVPMAPSLDAVWDWRPDVVFVTSPTHLHLEQAIEAARRGHDLFIEKPVAHTLRGLDELERLVDERALVTMVGCNMRFHPGPVAVKRLLDERAIGAVLSARISTGSYLPAWRPWKDYRESYSARADQGGGVLLDCIHEIDLALWYFGPGRLRASAVRPAASLGLDVPGIAELILDHEGGALSSVHLNFVQRDYRRGCEIVGETGTISWEFSRPEVIVRRGASDDEVIRLDATWTVNQMYIDEIRVFLDAVASRTPPMAPVAAGVAALRIAEGATALGTAA